MRTFVRGWRCSVCGADHHRAAGQLVSLSEFPGACPRCEGLGQVIDLDLDQVVPDRSKSIREGAIAPWNVPAYRGLLADFLQQSSDLGFLSTCRLSGLAPTHVKLLLDGAPDAGFAGLSGFFERLDEPLNEPSVQAFLGQWRHESLAPSAMERVCGPRRWRFASGVSVSPSYRL